MTNQDPANILTAWNETDPERRRAILDAMTSQSIVYDDVHKNEPAQGRVAFDDFLAVFQSRVAGASVTATTPAERLGDAVRFGFAVRRGDTTIGRGTYFGVTDEQGRFTHLYGFIDAEVGQ